MKKVISSVIVVVLLVIITSCSIPSSSDKQESVTSYSTNILVYLPVDYIDLSVLHNFEETFNVGVKIAEFDSNEDMYASLIKSNKYDVVVSSDYMLDRLIQENRIVKLDQSKLSNTSYISSQYLHPVYDEGNEYTVPYMVGTLGILYNKRTVKINSWNDLFNHNGILVVDSERDVIGLILCMLGYSMNTINDGEISEAKIFLQRLKSNMRGYYESVFIQEMLAAEESYIGIVYSGDGKRAVDLNPNLNYIIPKEGTNKWVDGFVIPTTSQNIDIAHEFINFMCSPNIAIRNMSYTGYTSPVETIWNEFYNNRIMFPTEEELIRCESLIYSTEIVSKYSKLWKEVR